MATLIKSKQIEGVVTASVVEGGFVVSGSQTVTGPISASSFIGNASQLTGIDYSQIENTPIFRAGTNVTITTGSLNGSTTYTINSTGGNGGGNGGGGSTDISYLNQATESLQSQIDAIVSATSSFITSDNTGSDSQTLTIVGNQLTISSGNTITIPTGSNSEGISSWNELTDIPSGLVSGSYVQSLPNGLISSSVQVLGGSGVLSGSHTDISALNQFSSSIQSQVDALIASTSSYLTSETDNQTLTIVGDQLTISDGNTITIPTGSAGDSTDISSLNEFTSSIQSQVDGLSSVTSSYLTELPNGIMSGSEFTDFSSSVHTELQNIQHTDISSLNDYTSSNDLNISELQSASISFQSQLDGLSSLTSSYLTSETDSQTLSIDGNQLTISDGNTITIPTGSGGGVSSWNDLTDIPNNIISGSQQISDLGFVTSSSESEFDGNRIVSNTLLGDLYSQSFNAGTSGSLRDFIEATFFPSYAPTATFTDQTAKFNINLATDGTNLVSISVSDTVNDSPYVVTLSGTDSDSFIPTPTNADSSSWELRANGNLSSATYSYNVIVTDKNSASRTYSGRSLTIAQADNGTLTPTGTFYIIESATTGPIYLSSTGRNGSQGGVTVAYSPNYGSQVATNFTSTNSLISVNSTSGLLSVGSPISGSGNESGSVISTTIGWEDQYGNTDSSNININVSKNNAPDIVFTNTTANLNTNTSKLNGGTLVTLSFSDTESDAINHNSFQFTDTSGQLTATKSGNNYLVTANSNLSGSRSYGITASIEDIHGFRSNIESSSFSIVQSGRGTLGGDTSIYIIESALTSAVFRDSTGFGNGNTAQVSVTYSPSAGSQTISSYSSTNPAILIDSSGNLTLGIDLSGSVTQSGDTFTSTISFQDQYGNVGSGSVTAYVFANNAPAVSFVSSSNYTTDTATSGSNAGVITISDTETNSPYRVELSGSGSNLFYTVPQNSATSSVQIKPLNPLSAGTYLVDIIVTDTYGKFSTLSNKSIVVDSVADTYGTIYVYTHNLGPAGTWSSTTYNGIYGISTVNSDTPAQVTEYTTSTSLLGTLVNNDVIGDNTITFNSSYTMTLRDTISGDTTLDSALDTDGSISINGNTNIFLLYPSGSDMSVPISIQETINGVNGGAVPYLNVDSEGWGIASAKLNSIILGTPHLGYSEWFVLGRLGTDGVGTSLQYRLINSNGGNAPS